MTTDEILKKFDENYSVRVAINLKSGVLANPQHAIKDFIKQALDKVERETEKRVAEEFEEEVGISIEKAKTYIGMLADIRIPIEFK